MEIQFGRGPFAPPLEGLTKIGDELTVGVCSSSLLFSNLTIFITTGLSNFYQIRFTPLKGSCQKIVAPYFCLLMNRLNQFRELFRFRADI